MPAHAITSTSTSNHRCHHRLSRRAVVVSRSGLPGAPRANHYRWLLFCGSDTPQEQSPKEEFSLPSPKKAHQCPYGSGPRARARRGHARV